VVFDLDGTLCNSIRVILESYVHAFATVGITITEEQARPWIGQTLPDTFNREVPDHALELEKAYREFNEANMEQMIEEYPGIPQLLDELTAAGIKIGVATSKRRAQSIDSMRYSKIDGHIPLVVTMEDTAAHKPQPDPLLKALAFLGGKPNQAAYVGDAVVDLQAAKAAGMVGIGVTWGAGIPEDLAAQHPAALCATVDELRVALLS
jgi:pyrophosphatase PpaX